MSQMTANKTEPQIVINCSVSWEAGFDTQLFCTLVLAHLSIETGYFEFNFVSAEEIKTVNQTHLNHDYVTDIITFNLGNTDSIWGDIYICVEDAKANAKAYDNDINEEIKELMIHGILHLLDYTDYTPEDKAAMVEKQRGILKAANAQLGKVG